MENISVIFNLIMFNTLNEFLDFLEKRNLLKRIKTEVDNELEISEICDRVVKKNGPALLFENVKCYNIPVAINIFGSEERTSLALGVDNLNELTSKMESFVKFAINPPTGGLIEKLKALPKLWEMSNILPKTVSDGICKEVVRKKDINVLEFPVLKCWPQDAGRYITFGLVFSKNPYTGIRNCGIYRLQVYDRDKLVMHWQIHKDGALHEFLAREKGEKKIDVAVAIGPEPVASFGGAMPAPPDVDEMLLAGLIKGESIKMIKCETVNVEVPASSQIILEGYVDLTDLRVEGPFGDHTGFYSLEDKYPTFKINCITHKKNPIYQTIIVGKPIMEDCFIGKAIERFFLPLMKLQLPEIIDVNMPYEGCFHNLIIVSIKKRYPGQARKVMHALWGMGQAMFSKIIVVVDEDVNVQDLKEVAWKAMNNIDPQRDFEFVLGPVDALEHASRLPCFGSKVGIDATKKWKEEGFNRPWPNEIVVTNVIKELVNRKWNELGL